MSRSKKSSGNKAKNNTNSFQSLKSKILSDIENDSSQSENFVSEPLDKEIQLVDDINNIINSNDTIDNSDSNIADYSDDDYYDSDDSTNDSDDYMDDYLSNDTINTDDSTNDSDDYMDDYLSNDTINTDDSVSVSGQELLKTYIGKNYEKIVSTSFNVYGFLFTMFYALFRKMYSYSLIIFAIVVASFIFTKSIFVCLIIYFVLAIFVGLTINKIYISSAKRKINRIKKKNINMNYYEIKDICSLNGGTSIRGVVFIALVEVLCFFAILFVVGGFNFNLKENLDNIFNVNKDNDKDKEKKQEDDEYHGFISYNSKIKMSDEFAISVPNTLVNDSSSYTYSYNYYAENDVFSSCRFKFGSVLGYSSSNQLISGMIDYYSKSYRTDSSISFNKSNINNVEWIWFFYKTSSGMRYFYATTKGKNVYLFSYEIDNNTILNECEGYRVKVLDSIESK